MLTITNEKVAGFVPRWAPFRGFSILFDNPGDSLTPDGAISRLTCDTNTPFYQALCGTMHSLNVGRLVCDYLFCPLPPLSYHVTVWDGGNAGNFPHVVPEQQPDLERYLQALPDALTQPDPVTDLVLASPLVQRRDWNIALEFQELFIWNGYAMVARLAPSDDSRETFEALVQERDHLNRAFHEQYGISASANYKPHVSLGYFANPDGGLLAAAHQEQWNQFFAKRLQGLTLDFTSASLYGFTDMETFFKATL